MNSPTSNRNGAPKNANFPIIGVRDSGVGGLTVAQAIKRAVPHAQLLYFADTAHVPYGDRAPDEVKFFALSISQWLLERGAQTLVFACNTTSAYALDDARARFSCPVIGMIAPGARAALAQTRNYRIGILATQATVDSGVYTRTILATNPAASSFEVPCPSFVPLVESERTESDEAHAAARKYLQPLREAGCDTAILGCTHYPLLLPILQQLAPEIHFIDPARAVAENVAATLPINPKNQTQPQDIFYVSGAQEGVRHWISALLKNHAPRIESGPVFEMPKNARREIPSPAAF